MHIALMCPCVLSDVSWGQAAGGFLHITGAAVVGGHPITENSTCAGPSPQPSIWMIILGLEVWSVGPLERLSGRGNPEGPTSRIVSLPLRASLLPCSWALFSPRSLLNQVFLSEFCNFKVWTFLFCFILPLLYWLCSEISVHKLFITYPILEFTFPFNFYECFLC